MREAVNMHACGTAHTLPREELSGFLPGAPTVQAYRTDSAVCAAIACSCCDAPAPRYEPYLKTAGPAVLSYRAFAVCSTCGHVDEF